MQGNLRRYPWYVATTTASPWLPVFFLYFTEQVGFVGAVNLSATYYLSVVLLEVPSGYLSDRFGRRCILLAAALCMILAYSGFLLASGLPQFLVCQVLLAAGIAFQSGSDSALLHDSLAALEQSDDYAEAEARAQSYGMASASASALLGGVLGSFALWWPYVFGLIAAGTSLVLSYRFVEPAVDRNRAKDLGAQVRTLATRIRDPFLRWMLLWYVLAFVLAHVTFELYQPWIRQLGQSGSALAQALAAGDRTPILSGVVLALSMFGGMLGAMASLRIAKHVSLQQLLLLANLLQLVIIAGLAVWLHPAVLVLIFMRNFGMNMTHAPTMAAIAPRIDAAERATWLSLQSLVGRLGFALVLYCLSLGLDDEVSWPLLSQLLWICTVGGVLASVWLAFIGRRLAPLQE